MPVWQLEAWTELYLGPLGRVPNHVLQTHLLAGGWGHFLHF